MRAPFQILVFPYLKSSNNEIKYCVFKRKDLDVWQGIAGGGEANETPLNAAKRESFEEAGILTNSKYIQLTSMASISAEAISGFIWGKEVLVIPEYSFGVEVKNNKIQLKNEHTSYEWLDYTKATRKLKWDSNRTALWELNHRLTKGIFK